jgi:hypothetical protein
MTRFAATTLEQRRALITDAIAAHRERTSSFCTFEPDPADAETPPPWIQYADGVLNLDCTDDELARLKGLLDGYPAFTIDELNRPEEAEGTNVRLQACADDQRIAELVDEIVGAVYDREEGYRLWATQV